MSDIDEPALKERLWHDMRTNLAQYDLETNNNELLRCCICGRLLEFKDFSLEHIIPQQALDNDPTEIKSLLPRNMRSKNILLCKSPLRIKNTTHANGCNGWKGRFYDKPIKEIFSGRLNEKNANITSRHTISAAIIAYIAMFSEYMYAIPFTPYSILIRKQFFRPNQYIQGLPIRSHTLFFGSPPTYSEATIDYWRHPFDFNFERDNACLVRIRNMTIFTPISQDPRTPIASRRLITPQRYKLRPDFSCIFS